MAATEDTTATKKGYATDRNTELENGTTDEWMTVKMREQRKKRRESLAKEAETDTPTPQAARKKLSLTVAEKEREGTAEQRVETTRQISTAMVRKEPGHGQSRQTGGAAEGESRMDGGDETVRKANGRAAERAEVAAERKQDSGTSRQGQQGDRRAQPDSGTKFEKELTVTLEITGEDEIPVLELLRCIRVLCGGLIACRATGARKYEVTMSHIKGKERLLDGFKIGECNILAREVCNDELMVSFLNLPAYVTDEEILQKLEGWGVSAASNIRRRMWPGTQIADGTRFLKVKFTDTVQSLPYSARFDTAAGPEYFRVIHDRQVRVCRMCLQPGHILRECPEFFCHKCGVQGHYARECSSRQERRIKKCKICQNNTDNCICNYSEADEVVEEEDGAGNTSEGEAESEEEGCEGGRGTAQEAGGEAPAPQRSPCVTGATPGKRGGGGGGTSASSCLPERGRERRGDRPEKGLEPRSVADSMEVGETPVDKQPAAAAPPNTQASNASSTLLLQGSSEGDSEMELEAVKNIRKQTSSTTSLARSKRRKKKEAD